MQPKQFAADVCRMLVLVTAICLATSTAYSQQIDSSSTGLLQSFGSLSEKGLRAVNNKYAALQQSMDKQTQSLLNRMQRREKKLQNKLQGIDSTKYNRLYADTRAKYQELQNKMNAPMSASPGFAQKLKGYVPGLDSMQTALRFLQQKGINLSPEKLQQLQLLGTQLSQLQGKLQVAGEVQSYLQQRSGQLQQGLSNLKLGNQLTGINKETYYYQQRFAAYKSMIGDKDKIKQTLITEAAKLPAFQKFWQKNSMLAAIFPFPENTGADTAAGMPGLQTKAQVGDMIQQKMGVTGPGKPGQSVSGDAQGYLQQQVQQAKGQLDQLKNKISQLGGGSSDLVMPDFKPNNQKTKTFLKRLEYGFNIQNTSGSSLLPAISNIAVTLGYKINDRMTAGVGASYLIGWGTPVKDIHFSSQGAGIRSFIDVKARGSFWLTGGFEYNYMQAFSTLSSLKNIDVWQKSALAGLTKKTKIGNKTANLQLLYDFLAVRQIPQTQPLKFRVGYSF